MSRDSTTLQQGGVIMTAVSEARGRAQKQVRSRRRSCSASGLSASFLVLVVVASLWSDSFLTRPNILNVLRQVASGAGIMAVGMLFVILTRGIDLSVGSVAALGSVLVGLFHRLFRLWRRRRASRSSFWPAPPAASSPASSSPICACRPSSCRSP